MDSQALILEIICSVELFFRIFLHFWFKFWDRYYLRQLGYVTVLIRDSEFTIAERISWISIDAEVDFK